jgi:hypothetical protein
MYGKPSPLGKFGTGRELWKGDMIGHRARKEILVMWMHENSEK